MALEVVPQQPFGSLVFGWNPSARPSPAEVAEVKRLLAEHLVLAFRGQENMCDADLIAFAECFGDLIEGQAHFVNGGPVDNRILVVSNITENGVDVGAGGCQELPWHFDYCYMPRVAKQSFLNAVTLPKKPPRTSFSNQYAALEDLPADMLKRLRGLRAFYTINVPETEDRQKLYQRAPEAFHPLIMAHPETGRKSLYVSPTATRSIEGLEDEEVRDLVAGLCEHLRDDSRIYHHDWRDNDLVLFDAIGTQHRRDAFSPNQSRYMRQLSTLY